MDSKLNFKFHIIFRVKKMNIFYGLLNRLCDVLTTAQLIKNYFSHIQPILQYGIIVYGTANKTSLQKLEIKQNQFLRVFVKKTEKSVSNTFKGNLQDVLRERIAHIRDNQNFS